MDDLSDAIQDAVYIGAMCDPAPLPRQSLELITDEEALVFSSKLKASNAEALTYEAVLSETLGYYLFKQHLEAEGNLQAVLFVESALEFSVISTPEVEDVRFGFSASSPDPARLPVASSASQEHAESLSMRSTAADGHATGPLPAAAADSPVSMVLLRPDVGLDKSLPKVYSRRGVHNRLAVFQHTASADAGADKGALSKRHTEDVSVTEATAFTATVTGTVMATDTETPALPAAMALTVPVSFVRLHAAGRPPPPLPMYPRCFVQAADDPIAALRHSLRFRNGDNVRAVIVARQKSMTVRARAAALYSRFKSPSSPIGVDGDIVDVVRLTIATCLSQPRSPLRDGPSPPKPRSASPSKPSSARSSASQVRDSVLPPSLFDELADAVIEGCRARFWGSFLDSPYFLQYLKFKQLETRPVSVPDFVNFRVLGRGGFGSVNGCRKRNTGKLYAMKVMNKRRIKMKNASDLCWNERVVLSRMNSPFVVSLKYAFQTAEDLYLVLDMMPGGDLSFHLGKCGRFTEQQACFYAAEILLGLEHLHSFNIVYRDLKPENILLDMEGHCRITDMGLATHVTPKLAGRCGTRGYWAPEMLIKVDGKRQTYGFSVDWWSFGCLLYEFLYGKCPFRTDAARSLDPDKHKSMDKATLHLEVTYPSRYFSDEARSLIQGLLIRDPLLRLGANGAAEVKAHPFFAHVDWGMLDTGQVAPPFIPDRSINAASQDAIGAFESIRRVALEPEDHSKFEGWASVNKQAFQTEIIEYLAWEKAMGPVRVSRTHLSCCAQQ